MVITQQQIDLSLRVFGLQRMQSVHCVAGARAVNFAFVHHHLWQMPKSQVRHSHAMAGIGQCAGFMPGLSSRDNVDTVKIQLNNGRLDQGRVSRMWRIKRAAKNPQAEDACVSSGCVERQTQTQSLGTKKWLSKRSSGEPASSLRWYDQRTSGGMDSKIDSVRPPDWRPKCVPRSHTKLNST